MVLIHQRYGQTDRWTDGRDGQTDAMRSQDRALHCSALRGKNVGVSISYNQPQRAILWISFRDQAFQGRAS